MFSLSEVKSRMSYPPATVMVGFCQHKLDYPGFKEGCPVGMSVVIFFIND